MGIAVFAYSRLPPFMRPMGPIHPNHSRTGRLTLCVVGSALALVVFFAPLHAHGQCQPLSATSTVQSSSPQHPASAQPEFFDEPQFTVAGVTDTTNLGGHGSNTVARTKDALAKDVALLGGPSVLADPVNAPGGGAGAGTIKEGGSVEKNDPLGTVR